MATQLQVYNRALFHLGEARLATLTDDVESRRVLDEIWESVLEDALSRGDWNFAMKTVLVPAASGVTPSPGYQSTFNKPSDWLRTIAFSNTEYVDESFADDIEVLDEGERWHARNPILYVRYISLDFATTASLQFYPVSYVRFLEYLLARDICERVTQGTGLYEKLHGLTLEALLKAKSNDARNQKETRIRRGRILTAMQGNATRRNSDRFNTLGGVIPAQKGGV